MKGYLRQRADGGHDVGRDQHDLGQVGVGHVGDGAHDGVQPVQGDDDHDEAGQVEANDPTMGDDPIKSN